MAGVNLGPIIHSELHKGTLGKLRNPPTVRQIKQLPIDKRIAIDIIRAGLLGKKRLELQLTLKLCNLKLERKD